MKFIRAKHYYYNIDTDTIYGREYGSFGYYHEVSHYLDHKNRLYSQISFSFSALRQAYFMIFILIFIDFSLMVILGMIISIWTIQEELRADIYAIRKRRGLT